MRTYVKPAMEVVNLRVEERISGSVCKVIGSCMEGGVLLVSNEID